MGKFTAEDRINWASLYLGGISPQSISDMYGMRISNTLSFLKRYEITRDHNLDGRFVIKAGSTRFNEIVDLYSNQRKSINYLRRKYGVSNDAIKSVLRLSGIEVEDRQKSVVKRLQDQDVIPLYEMGFTVREISQFLSVSRASITRFLNLKKIKIRPTDYYKIQRGGSNYSIPVHYKNGKKNYYFKSTWEYLVSQYLTKKRMSWKYEPMVFKLSNNSRYTPDFIIYKNKKVDCVIEVKGAMLKNAQSKINLFKQDYPGIKFCLWRARELRALGIL